jgi:hypothetical protein
MSEQKNPTKVTQLPKLEPGKTPLTIGNTQNGVSICLPAPYVEAINNSPYLEAQVDAFGEMVVEVENRTGKQFARPVMLNAEESPLAFATMLADRKDIEAQFGKELFRELNKGRLEEDKKAYVPLLTFPLTALLEDSSFDMKIIEGIVMHELGHAASRDVLKLEADTMLWQESLMKISEMCQLVEQMPELAAPITKQMGGNEAYLAQADTLFEKINGELTQLMAMSAVDGHLSAESMLDHVYYDRDFMQQYKTLASLGTGKTLKEFEPLHDATVDLICGMIRDVDYQPESLVKLRTDKPKMNFRPIEEAHPAHAAAINRFSGFHQIANHTGEYLADDFATRHHAAPTSYLEALPPHGSGETHPATSRRVQRADILDTHRIALLEAEGAIDEELATKLTNEATRPQPRPAPSLEMQKKFVEALEKEAQKAEAAEKEARRGESFVKRTERNSNDCGIGRG